MENGRHNERRKKLVPAKSAEFVRDLRRFTITVDLEGLARVFSTVLDQARLYQRTAYDASYLELAKRRGLPLATRDQPLGKAAQELGISLFQAVGGKGEGRNAPIFSLVQQAEKPTSIMVAGDPTLNALNLFLYFSPLGMVA